MLVVLWACGTKSCWEPRCLDVQKSEKVDQLFLQALKSHRWLVTMALRAAESGRTRAACDRGCAMAGNIQAWQVTVVKITVDREIG